MGPSRIRNVVLVGHGGAGKTTLAEALLHAAGLTTRMGRIEDGNTVTDFEPEEIERASSVGLAVAPFEWADHKINLVDTPGYADFVGDVRAGLRACDLALFVVSGVDGVEVQTEILWRMAAEEGLARAVFVSKLDRERADYRRTLDQLKQRFGTGIAPVEVPIGAEASLEGVAGIVSNRAFLYDGIDPGGKEAEIPEEVRSQVEDVRTALVEAVVESDDDLLERYFEGEEPTDAQLIEGLRAGIGEGTIFPVLCGSATQLIGIDRLADLVVRDAPRPGERSLPALAAGNGFSATPDGPVVAYVFKTMSDPYVGRISLFRVYSGTLKLDT
ncbi:MAG: GTP-binding protein, partial [Acidimicrobiia bacterium]